MLLLADRNFAATALVEQIAAARAHVLIRCKDTRKRLRDRSWLTPTGSVTVRVIAATITVRLDCGGTRVGPPGHHHDRRTTLPSR